MQVELHSPSPKVIAAAADVIRKGGVVLYPSDTVYGLGCDPMNQRALRRLFAIKDRAAEKGVLVLIPDLSWIAKLVIQAPDWLNLLGSNFWPGPLTVLLWARPDLPELVTGDQGTIGIRLPDSPFLQAWMGTIPGPLVSTSANLSGESPLSSSVGLASLFGEQVDLFLDAGDLPCRRPSTVVDLTGDIPRIVRHGEIGDQIARFLAHASHTGG